MNPWNQLSGRKQRRIKEDPTLFAQFWRDQLAQGQPVACARMVESCILSKSDHKRVPVTEITKRTGLSLAELARLLVVVGGIAPAKVIVECPDKDPAKTELVKEMSRVRELFRVRSEPISLPRREDKHPYVLTRSFINQVARSTKLYDARRKTFVAA